MFFHSGSKFLFGCTCTCHVVMLAAKFIDFNFVCDSPTLLCRYKKSSKPFDNMIHPRPPGHYWKSANIPFSSILIRQSWVFEIPRSSLQMRAHWQSTMRKEVRVFILYSQELKTILSCYLIEKYWAKIRNFKSHVKSYLILFLFVESLFIPENEPQLKIQCGI